MLFIPCIPYCHTTKGLFSWALLTQYIMFSFQQKIVKCIKRYLPDTQTVWRTEQVSEPDSDMAGMLEFITSMVNMLKTLTDKNKRQVRTDGQSKWKDRISKNQKEMPVIKNTVTGLGMQLSGRKFA
jgi:tRNA uridine 5-carbamoylmethylation protein Kti12